MNKPTLTTIYEDYINANGIKREGYATLYKMYGGKKVVDSEDIVMRLYLLGIERLDRAYENFRKLQIQHSKELNTVKVDTELKEKYEKEETDFYIKRIQSVLIYDCYVTGWKLSEDIDYANKTYSFELTSSNGAKIKGSITLMPQYLIGSIQTNLISIYAQMKDMNSKSILKSDWRRLEEFRDTALHIMRHSKLTFK